MSVRTNLYKCKKKGHMAVDCNTMGSKKLKMGMPGQGFYAFDLPEEIGKVNQATGLITVLEGEANEEKLDKELKHLVKETWNFKVGRIDKQEFIVVFPGKSSLDTFAKLSSFEISLYGLKGKLEKSSMDPGALSVLQTVWTKTH
jgi:hypothetical protein